MLKRRIHMTIKTEYKNLKIGYHLGKKFVNTLMLYTTSIRRFNDSQDLNLNNKMGNALREYKKTITLSQMQKEVNALRAPLLALY